MVRTEFGEIHRKRQPREPWHEPPRRWQRFTGRSWKTYFYKKQSRKKQGDINRKTKAETGRTFVGHFSKTNAGEFQMCLTEPVNERAVVEAGQQVVDALAAGKIRGLHGVLGKQNQIGGCRPGRAVGFIAPLINRVTHPVARVLPG